MSPLNEKRCYQFFIPFSMLYFTLSITAHLLSHKLLPIDHHMLTAGTPIITLWFILNDVITEVYGYQIVKKLFWNLAIIEFLFCSGMALSSHLASPPGNPAQLAYVFILGSLLRPYSIWLGVLFCVFLNAYLISRWKILLMGKYFWLRSMVASAIAMLIFTAIAIFEIFWGTSLSHQIAWIILWGFIFKMITLIIFSLPASLCAAYLKKKEGINIFDQQINYNPFKIH